MTARTGTTAELLSGLAAAMLFAIYNALTALHKENNSAVNWNVVKATYLIGAIGFVGLTVWNLRVQKTVHTCFTSQTIVAVYVQVHALTKSIKAANIIRGFMILFAGVYVVGFIVTEKPFPDGAAYFDFQYNWFVIGQYLFFIGYFVTLMYLVYTRKTDDNKGHETNQRDQLKAAADSAVKAAENFKTVVYNLLSQNELDNLHLLSPAQPSGSLDRLSPRRHGNKYLRINL